jgi:hypothetical protein
MSAKSRQVQEAEALLEDAAGMLQKALEDRDSALRETASIVNRRRASELVGLSRGRVQQIINAPWSHRVTFVGVLDKGAEEALSAAGMDIRVSRGGGSIRMGGELPPMLKHSLYVKARSAEEALSRVERTLRGRGSFANFKVEVVSPG